MAIIGVSSLNRYVGGVGGERLTLQHFCPSCGRPMGLVCELSLLVPGIESCKPTRMPGLRSVWITEGDSGENSRKGISVRK